MTETTMTDAPPTAAEQYIRAELISGLTAPAPRISSKFLYDSLGSKLFEAIFRHDGEEIAQACGIGATLVDLGAGNCAKAASLFPLLRPTQYVAVDISSDFVHAAVERLRRRFTGIDMQAVAQDFSAGLALPGTVGSRRRLFFYPGSSIGISVRTKRSPSSRACASSATPMAACCSAWTSSRIRQYWLRPTTTHWA